MSSEVNPLIGVAELVTELSSESPPVVLDVRWYLTEPERGRVEFEHAHIPRAQFVAVEHELSAPVASDRSGGRHPLPAPDHFQSAMRRVGLNDSSTVVILDQGPSLSAGRLWWMLRDGGFDRVRVLNGGFAAWTGAGQPTEQGPSAVVTEGSITLTPGHLTHVDADALLAHLDGGGQLFDVRAAERFAGEVEPIDPIAGHIPGAQNLPASTLQRDGYFLPAAELAPLLAVADDGDVVSCGSGITACQVLLAAEAAGVSGLRLYAGSWSDWISDPQRPVATGR